MMASIASLRTRTLLAMSTALRPSLLGASTPCRLRSIQARSFSASSFKYELVKFRHVASLLVPEFQTSPVTVIPPDELLKTSSLPSATDEPLPRELAKLFTTNPTFLYAESDFYKLKKNTSVPEVCILGRSNVGKSSFINALASRRKKRIAAVSSKAGKTTTMNSYGFGPPKKMTPEELRAQGPRLELSPTHTFHLVDMPGYGYASLDEWGENISLYLDKRDAVKGAIVLIDAEVGPKKSDAALLRLLCAAQLRTAIVLSKADKGKRGLTGLRDVSTRIRDMIHSVEAENGNNGWAWERDIYVTAVGSSNLSSVKATIATARLAVARLAGLTKDERPDGERNTRWSGKMVSFDDLQYAAGESAAPTSAQSAQDSASPSTSTLDTSNTTSPIPDVEQTPNTLVKNPTRTGKGFQAQGSVGSRSISTRAFHSASFRAFQESNSSKAVPANTKAALEDLLQSLQVKSTSREDLRRLRQNRDGKVWVDDPRRFDRELRTPGQRHPDMVRSAEDTLIRHQMGGTQPFKTMEAARSAKPPGPRGEALPRKGIRQSKNDQAGKNVVKNVAKNVAKNMAKTVPVRAPNKTPNKVPTTEPKDAFEMAFAKVLEQEPKKAPKKKSKKATKKPAKKGRVSEETSAIQKARASDKARNQVMDANAFEAAFAESSGLKPKKNKGTG
jgi:GTP-binding protein EngB required for normal cell division